MRLHRILLALSALAGSGLIAGCAADHSPDIYTANAVQQANKVEPAVVAGFRQVAISANGTVGAVTGGAVGGILGGAQAGGTQMGSALGAVGGGVVGSLIGSTLERVTGDSTGWEYIVRKANGELLSVTQREPKPLAVGQKVLVITGNQARIVPDYSTPGEASTTNADNNKDAAKETAKKEPAPVAAEAVAGPVQLAPTRTVSAAEPAAPLPRATQD